MQVAKHNDINFFSFLNSFIGITEHRHICPTRCDQEFMIVFIFRDDAFSFNSSVIRRQILISLMIVLIGRLPYRMTTGPNQKKRTKILIIIGSTTK